MHSKLQAALCLTHQPVAVYKNPPTTRRFSDRSGREPRLRHRPAGCCRQGKDRCFPGDHRRLPRRKSRPGVCPLETRIHVGVSLYWQ